MKYIPLEIILSYLKATTLPIVSVGSGNGVCEKFLENNGITDLILVDPEPESWKPYPENKSEYLKPNYSYVKDLIEDKPNIVGECTLFLNWPNPSASTYDIEAVKMLNPRFVVLFYETIGGAGGEQFHAWLDKTGAPSENFPLGKDHIMRGLFHFILSNTRTEIDPKYEVPNEYTYEKGYIINIRLKNFIPALILIKRNDVQADLSHVQSKTITL